MNKPKTAVAIGSRLEMLIDDWLVENRHNINFHLTDPRREEVVWQAEKPWEGPECCYFRVLSDGSKVRLYYRAGHDPVEGSLTCYAESSDGIHFEKPTLGLYEYEDSRDNNIVFRGSPEDSFASHNFAPFLDTNPQAKPEERYKAIGGYRLPDYTARVAYAFGSPDGIRWKKLQDAPILTEGKLDSLNIAFWDEKADLYRCYSRYMKDENGVLRRAIQSCTSPDFQNWSPVQPNLYEAATPEFYTNAVTPAPNAPHILLSFPMRYVPQRKKIKEHPVDSVSDAVFMSSRDGVNWDRTFAEAWIRPGRDQRNWTDRSNMTAPGFAVTSPEQVSFYVSEHYRWPDNRLCRYSIRRDGFASLRAGVQVGEWTTRPLIFKGRNLTLNYSTAAAGSLRVEVQNEARQPLPGYELSQSEVLFGDELDAYAQWQNHRDLQALQGQVIRLRFVMQEADLYALQMSG